MKNSFEHFTFLPDECHTGQKAKAHVDMVTLVYNSMKLASFRLKIKQKQTAA